MNRICVIGAGLAGLTASFRLQQAGYQVTLLEKYPDLGGRTSSFTRKGMHLESGLHNYFGFYHHLSMLIRDADIELKDIVHWDNDIYFFSPDLKAAKFTIAPLASPLRTIKSFLGNTHYLNARDKWQLIKLLSIGLKDYLMRKDYLDQITIAEYAQRLHIGSRLLNRFIRPFSEGIFFLKPEEESAFVFISILIPHMPHILQAQIGGFKGGMTDVLVKPIVHKFEGMKGRILPETTATEIIISEGKVSGVETSQGKISCDAVIVATGISAAKKLIYPAFRDHKFAQDLHKLEMTPTLGMQITLRQPLFPHPSTHFGLARYIGTMAEESHTTFPDQPGRLSLIFKDADTLLEKSDAELIKLVAKDLMDLGFDIEADIVDYASVKWETDFYSMRPGSEKLRPPQKTSVPGLFMAGDYTKQKFMSTMEGACYSGELAAQAVRAYL
jgi:15-cis-phytoene desaturase